MGVSKSHSPCGWCKTHQKQLYIDRRRAKLIARITSKKAKSRKTTYPCSVNPGLWHVGGLPEEVKHGHMTRGAYYGRKVS